MQQGGIRVHFKQKIETGFPHGSSGRLSRSNYSNLINSSDDIQHRQQVRGSSFFLNFNPKHSHCSLSEFDPQCPRFTHSTQQWRVNADRPCVLNPVRACGLRFIRLMCLKDRIALTPHINLTSLMKYPELLLKRKTTGFLQSLAHKSN